MFFASKIRQAAKSGGTQGFWNGWVDVLWPNLASCSVSILIFDLNSKTLNPFDLIQKVKAAPELKEAYCIGYFPHVEKDLKKEALAAGVDEVMPRSRFSMELASILKEYGNP